MRMTATRRAVMAFVACTLGGGASAWAQVSDATMTVTLRVVGGAGQFNNMGRIATQVRVFAESGVSARWNGPTNVYAPTVGAVGPGGTFTVTVPSLYSQTRVPGNTYAVQLFWTDTTMRTVTAGTVTPRAGTNTAGPFTVTNGEDQSRPSRTPCRSRSCTRTATCS